MPRKNRDFIDDLFEIGMLSPRVSLVLTFAFSAAFAVFKWVWLPPGMFSILLIWATGAVAAVGFVATLTGFYHHARRQRTLDRQRSLDDLRHLSWQQFEHLVSDVYKRQGYASFDNGGAGDGGVDVILRRDGIRVAVQCKQWKTWSIGEPAIREFLGAIVSGKYDRGIFVTVGNFTKAAQQFAAKNSIELVSGDQLLDLVKAPQDVAIAQIPSTRQKPDIGESPPYCPKCSASMVKRIAKKGDRAGSEFWGCSNYPQCRGTLPVIP